MEEIQDNHTYLLSPSQESLWFMDQLTPGVPVYNEAEAVRLKGKLDAAALEKALNLIVARHEILRSTIQVVDEKPMAVVHEQWPLKFKRIDLQNFSGEQRQAEVERLLVEEPRHPYHLQTEPGIRATLIQLGAEEHVFILMMHHIIWDWSSGGVLWRELSASYRALFRGERPALPALGSQHRDYARWQNQHMADRACAVDLEYWAKQLQGAPGLLELPTDRPRPPVVTYHGARKRFRIGSKLVQALRECSQREKISPSVLFAAGLQALLYRYTGSDDVSVGFTLPDRERMEWRSTIGFLLQLHVLRTRLSGKMTFRELLGRVQKDTWELHSHRSPTFEQVVSRVQPERNVSYPPLVQFLFDWRDRNQQLSFIGMEGLAIESLPAETRTAKFDVAFILTDDHDDVWLEVEYNTDLFDGSRIERMAGHYRMMLAAAAADTNCRLADLPLLTEAEHHRMLVEWNRTQAAYPMDRCVHQFVEERAQRAPEAPAVVMRDKRLTYGELNAQANQLARHLQKLGVGPESLVGICVERSPEMIVGILGILKAGGAYVPLDPGYPKERQAFMLNDARVRVLLTQQGLCEGPQFAGSNRDIFYLDTDGKKLADYSAENLQITTTRDNLAYVIYTSGSTGEPKGVELTHGSLLNLVFWHCEIYQVKPTDRATQLAGVGFDASVWELWPYLTTGASIFMPDEETRMSPEKLRDWLVTQEITLSFAPTPMAEALVVLLWPATVALRAMLTGGDRLTRHVPSSLPFMLVNHYGPTENTVVTTYAVVGVESEGAKAPPIGRPISNTEVYLLDEHLQSVPIGTAGELHIGGAGLARGYLRRPELTAEKFIANPFSEKTGARLYKTGDVARYLPNGMIEFLGRNDAQVKIRGFRIELGEIESVLAGHPGIAMAVVMAREIESGDKRLVAYLTMGEAGPTGNELREFLKAKMPDYMVPSVFVALDELPLTVNGKVDRAALPAPDGTNTLQDEGGVAPVTEIEKTVAKILASLLKLDRVDAEANFFDLGGHSLLGTQLIARLREAFGIELPLRKVFESPTVIELSAGIEEMLVAEVEAMSEEEVQTSLKERPQQQREGALK